MWIYFLLLRIAALFGHRKAKLLVKGQANALAALKENPLPKGGQVIWFHAASVGEFEQARPIIERIKKEHPAYPILLTFFSPSGYELRKNYDKVDRVLYLPFATRRKARAFIAEVEPKMAIFVKYEFWPAYLKELSKRQIACYSISAIFREKQLFFRAWGKPYLKLLKCFSHIFVQDTESEQLLQKHGIEKVTIAGDTRFDRVMEVLAAAKHIETVERFVQAQDELTQLTAGDTIPRVIVAGSTWPKDEELLVEYINRHPGTKLVLVPHEIHETHLHQIFCMLRGRVVRYTEANSTNIHHTQTLLIDTIGLLSSIYRYGQVAYIGGGFGVGIHNTIEAAVYGMPVLFGPNYQHFREAKGLIAAGAATSVKNYDELEAALDKAFAEQESMGANARMYVESELGATGRIYEAIIK